MNTRLAGWFFSTLVFGGILVGLMYLWDHSVVDPRSKGQVFEYIVLRLAALCLCLPAVVGAWLYIDSLTDEDWFVWEKGSSDLQSIVLIGKIVLLAVSLYVVGWILTSA